MKQKKLLVTWVVAALIMVLAVFGCTQQQAVQPAQQATVAKAATEGPKDTKQEGTQTVQQTTVLTPTQQTVAPAAKPAVAGGLLKAVKDRGKLICGINGGLPGFSNLESDGTYSGIDADFCRALAAAIFGNDKAIEYRQLSTQERFTALQTGEVDVLFRNTTWTLNRDTAVGLDFGPTTFYDGQGIMVRKSLNATKLEDLEGGTICVQSGTTTELNLTDQFRARGIKFEPVVFEEIDPTYNAYDEGRCDAVTSDKSQLLSRRTKFKKPDDHVILDITISKEPLGPAVVQGDSQWRDVVSWVVYATLQAEESGIDSKNIDTFMSTEDPSIKRFLGIEGNLAQDLGLPKDFTVNVIKRVGNYAEIYDRNLGPGTPFDLPRGLNAQWNNGGLMYSPPFR